MRARSPMLIAIAAAAILASPAQAGSKKRFESDHRSPGVQTSLGKAQLPRPVDAAPAPVAGGAGGGVHAPVRERPLPAGIVAPQFMPKRVGGAVSTALRPETATRVIGSGVRPELAPNGSRPSLGERARNEPDAGRDGSAVGSALGHAPTAPARPDHFGRTADGTEDFFAGLGRVVATGVGAAVGSAGGPPGAAAGAAAGAALGELAKPYVHYALRPDSGDSPPPNVVGYLPDGTPVYRQPREPDESSGEPAERTPVAGDAGPGGDSAAGRCGGNMSCPGDDGAGAGGDGGSPESSEPSTGPTASEPGGGGAMCGPDGTCDVGSSDDSGGSDSSDGGSDSGDDSGSDDASSDDGGSDDASDGSEDGDDASDGSDAGDDSTQPCGGDPVFGDNCQRRERPEMTEHRAQQIRATITREFDGQPDDVHSDDYGPCDNPIHPCTAEDADVDMLGGVILDREERQPLSQHDRVYRQLLWSGDAWTQEAPID